MLKRILQYLLILILFTPIFLDLHFYQPYIAGKYFYFSILVLLSWPLVIYFLCQKKNVWRSSLVKVSIIFFIGLSAINVFSQDLNRSWWGDWQRMDGWFYVLLYFIFWLGLIVVLDQTKYWQEMLRANQLALLVILIVAWGQWLQWPGLQDNQATRIYSLIGNANFLAHYLLLNFWLSIFSSYFDQRYRFIYWGSAVLILPIIYQTGSRSAMLGLVLTGLVFMIFWLKKIWSQNRKIFIAGIILLMIIMAGVWLTAGQRYKNFSLKDITIEARLVAWQAGWQGFVDKPLLGWGRNNFQIPFNKHVDFRIYHDGGSQLWFDKAHNQFIDYLSESGLFGFLLYLLWLAWPFYYWRRINSKLPGIARLALGLGLTANIIFLVFNFDTIISWLIYFIYLALLYFLAQPEENFRPIKSPRRRLFIFISGGLLAVVGLFYLVYQPILANYHLKKIQLASQNKLSWPEIQILTNQVRDYAPQYQTDLVLVLGGALDKTIWPPSQQIAALEFLSEITRETIKKQLLNAKLHYLFANIHLRLCQLSGSAADLYQAKDYYEQVLPHLTSADRPDFVYNLAQIYYELSFVDQEHSADLLNDAQQLLEANAKRFPEVSEAQDKLKIFLSATN